MDATGMSNECLSPPRHWRAARVVVQIALVCVVASAASGQNTRKSASVEADFQSWDELDVSAKVIKNVDASWVSQGRFSTQFPNPETYLSGADLNVSMGSHLVVTPSYYYLAVQTTSGLKAHYQVPMLAGTIKETWEGWTLSDRNRFLGAIGSDGDFWIYVNRPRADYRLGPQKSATSFFVWDEVFYFSIFHGWTRNRFAVGARRAINKQWAADLYYLHQDDGQIQPRAINGVGVTFEFRIR